MVSGTPSVTCVTAGGHKGTVLAYKLWEERGHPFGSPEVDRFAAERAVYSSLLTSGLITQSAHDSRQIAEKMYK